MVAPQDLSHDDDILSDILVDNLGSENCPISTHKMNGSYKSQRVHASLVRDLVWQQVIVEHNITGAVDQLCTMGIVKKYISNKDHRQLHAFKLHAKRYFEAYHPECGIEFVQSTRYSRASALLKQIAAAPPGSGAAGPSSTASTSAIPLAAEPSASASVSAPIASENGPDVTAVSVKTESSGPADASNLIPVDRPSESMPMQGVTNTASEPKTQTTVNESADVVMTDAKATDPTPVPLAKTEAPVTNGVAAITEAIITQLTDANGPPKESNGQIAPSSGPTDAMSTGASTPTATSAVSKGKRRIPSESGSKGKSTLNAQLASSWSDAFGSLAKADMAVCAIKSYKEGDFIEFLKGGVKDLTREEDEAMKVEAAAARDRLGPGQIAATAAPARDFSVIRSAQKGCSQLLLGPARFVNHDCNPNVEFYRSGQSITFRCTRPIMPKDEITCYYGPNYFEWGNAECLCATCEANGKGAFSVLAGVKLAGASHVGSPDLATGAEADIPGYSPGPEGSTSSVHSAHGSEAGSNGAGTGRRSSARVALVQASGRSRRMTPGGVPFPSMSMAPTSVSRRPSPSAETNGSSASAAEIDGVLGLGVSVSGSESSSHHNNNKVARVSCKTCHDPFEWQQTWFSAPRDCQRCVRHERIYRAPWPIRMAEVALEARRMHLDKQKKKKIHQERKAGDAESERATKKVKVSKKRSEPTPLRLDGVVLSASGGTKRSNGKGKEKASNNGTGISPAPSSSMTSSIDSLGMSSDSDSDLTELESSDEEDEGAGAASTSMMSTSTSTGAVIPSSASGRDFEREVEDADITLGGVGGVPAEAVLGRSVAGQGSEGLLPGAGQGGSGAPLLDPTPSLNVPTPAAAAAAALSLSPSKALAFADHLSRYGPTGKAPRTTLDFQARRREKPEPPWLDQDRRRSLRTKKSRSSRKSSSAAAAAKGGDSRKRQRESTSASAARRPRSSRAEGEEGSSSSSSRESSPGGPPVLGKDANLQNLAGFWGATDSERRIRRPVLAGGVTSLLERQRAESAAKRRAREREEAKAERRRKADRRRKSGGGGGGAAGNSENAGGAVVRMEKAKEDVKPPASRSRRSESPVKAGHQSLDSVLATSKTGNKATTTTAGAASSLMSSRKSMEVLQPLRSSNRQALKRDRMLAAGEDEGDDDEEEEDAGDDDSDEDDDFDASDISSTDDELEEEQEQVGGGGGEEKAGDQQQQQQQQEGGGGAEMRPPSRSVGRPRSNGKRSRQPASSGDDDDDSCSDDSDGSVQGTSRRRRRRRRSSSSSSSPTNSKKKRFVFSRSSSPMPNIPGLATKGPERTSNANLALAWSGGVAEGAKRTRKPVVREPISIGQASASGSRRSPSMGAPPSSRGRSSETPKPSMSAGTGVGASVPRSHRPVELSRLRSTSDAGDQEQDRKRRSRTSPALSVSSAANAAVVATAGGGSGKAGGAPGRPAHLAGPGGMRSSSAAAAAGGMRLDGRAGVPTAGSGGRYPSSSHSHSHSSAHRVLSGPSMPGGPPGGGASRRYSSSSSSQPGSPNLMYNMLPSPANPPVPGFRRPASPAGTPLSLVPAGGVAGGGSGNGGSAGGAGGSSANRNAGAPRRNLRWGSGKVTHSRPSPHLVAGSLPPSGAGAGGSTSPIGGPTTGPGGAVLSSSSSSTTTTTTPASFTTTRPPGVLGVKMDPGGLMRGGSGSPAGSPLMMSGGGLVGGGGGGRALGPAPPSSGEGGAKRETGTPPALTAGASGTALGVVPR